MYFIMSKNCLALYIKTYSMKNWKYTTVCNALMWKYKISRNILKSSFQICEF